MLGKQLETDENDLLREMVRSFAQGLMSADADAVCGAGYGEVSADRINRRNGYRSRRWDTRVGSIELKIPKLRAGSYFPDWFLDARTRSERAFIQVVAEAYVRGVSTRRFEGLVETLGIASLSKSQVSELATGLDEMAADFRNRPLDAGPYTYVWADALTMKVREGGRIVNIACLLAVGVNAEGHREILGVDLATSEDGAGWLAFFRGLGGTGPVGGPVGHLRRPHRAGQCHCRHPARCGSAAMPNPLPVEPVDQGPENVRDDGRHHGAHHLCSARPAVGVGPTPPGR